MEAALMVELQELLGAAGAKISSVLSVFGEEMLLIAVLGFLYWCYDKEFAKSVGVGIAAGLVLNPMIKNIVMRPRPYMEHPEIRCLKPVDPDADIMDLTAQGYSFPSGHSLNATILYGSLPFYKRKAFLIVIGILLPLLVGVARVGVGVHYPTDVLAGWAIGLCVILVLYALQKKVKTRWKLYLVIFLLSLPGMFFCRTNDYYTSLGTMAGFFLAVLFEEKYVRFRETRRIPKMIARLLGGFLIYFGLNTLLKAPFSEAFLTSATMGAFLVRAARYCVVVFVMLGIYPMIFDRIEFGEREQPKWG